MDKIIFFASAFGFIVLLLAGILTLFFRNEIIIEQRASALYKHRVNNPKDKNLKKEKRKNNGSKNKLIKPILEKSKQHLNGKMSKESTKLLERRLREAGYPFNWSPIEFRLVQLALGSVFFLLIAITIPYTSSPEKMFLLSILSGVYGAAYPNFYLKSKKKQRIKKIQKQMADFFDMATLSIEAGMGLDQALMKVCKQNEGPLSEEFLRTLDEMRLGKSRREAFSDLRYRVPVNQFQSIMSSLIQADQLGIGMSKILRQLTVRIREHQREAAREQAMKAPIKMMFPMIFFIFPSLFIVLLGPLVIYLITVGLGG